MNDSQRLSLEASLDKLRAALIFYKNKKHEEVRKCIKEVVSILETILGDNQNTGEINGRNKGKSISFRSDYF